MLITGCASGTSINTAETSNVQDETQTTNSTTNDKNQLSDVVLSFGEKANADNYSLSLLKMAVGERGVNGNQLRIQLVYEIENKSSEDFYVQQDYFDGYADDYLMRNNHVFSPLDVMAGLDYFGGTIAPGKKQKGLIEFWVPEDFQVFESRYTDPDGNHITYKLTREQFEISN